MKKILRGISLLLLSVLLMGSSLNNMFSQNKKNELSYSDKIENLDQTVLVSSSSEFEQKKRRMIRYLNILGDLNNKKYYFYHNSYSSKWIKVDSRRVQSWRKAIERDMPQLGFNYRDAYIKTIRDTEIFKSLLRDEIRSLRSDLIRISKTQNLSRRREKTLKRSQPFAKNDLSPTTKTLCNNWKRYFQENRANIWGLMDFCNYLVGQSRSIETWKVPYYQRYLGCLDNAFMGSPPGTKGDFERNRKINVCKSNLGRQYKQFKPAFN